MKPIFFFLLNLLLFSCNSTIKENYPADTVVVKRVDSMETIQNFPKQNSSDTKVLLKVDSLKTIQAPQIENNSKMEEEIKISKQENIISVHVENKIILVTIKNNFEAPIFYGAKMFFEKWKYEKWQKIDYVKLYGIPNMKYILQPGDTRTHPIYFSNFAVPPVKGKYRIIKGYYFDDKIKREEIKEFNID